MKIALALCGAVAALGLAGTAAAAPTTVSIVGCTLVHGGSVTVPAGSTVSFRFSWGARTAGLDEAFVNDVNIAATVDGTPVADTGSYWGEPQLTVFPNGDSGYLVTWLYPTGITLGAGDTMTLVFQGVLDHPITDGFTTAEGGGVASGDVLGGQDTCTVTGA
jgi:hypothetical protein